MTNEKESPAPPKQFGIFYPRGYVVVALRTAEDAERMHRSLVEGGYNEDDIKMLDTERVLAGATADLAQLSPFVRALGSEAQATESHRSGAAAGHTFLVAYAPSDLEALEAMSGFLIGPLLALRHTAR